MAKESSPNIKKMKTKEDWELERERTMRWIKTEVNVIDYPSPHEFSSILFYG